MAEDMNDKNTRRHYPRIPKKGKDEWEAYNIHLNEANRIIQGSEKAVKFLKEKELQ